MLMVVGRYANGHRRPVLPCMLYLCVFCQVLYMDHHEAALLMYIETICGFLEIVK
jgi:hypothetical protein